MKYSNRTEMKDQTYYTLFVFKDKNNLGERYKNEYKSFKNAIKKFTELKVSGLYQCVVLRKEEVFLRNPKTEISSSSPVKRWEVK